VWRDAVTRWFHRASGVADARGRVDTYPDRIEAESAVLKGYEAKAVTPWETASGTGAIECATTACVAEFKYTGTGGTRDIIVQYFDVNTGSARFTLRVGDRIIGEWTAADRLPTRRLDGTSSSRHVFTGVALKAGDTVAIEGTPDGAETAALDYIEIQQTGRGIR